MDYSRRYVSKNFLIHEFSGIGAYSTFEKWKSGILDILPPTPFFTFEPLYSSFSDA